MHVALAVVPVLVGFVLVGVAHESRDEVYNYRRRDASLIFLPTRRRHVQHNERARLRQSKRAAEALVKECESFMAGFENDPMRYEVLRAERDTAQREAKRLQDDLNRLVRSQRLEEKERKFKQLTGGR